MDSPLQRIAVIGPFPPLKGGISQHTAKLADACEARGMQVRRISWSSQYPKRLYGRAQIDETAATNAGVEWLLRWWSPLSWLRVGRAVRDLDMVVLPWVSPVHAVPQLLMLAMASKRTRRVIHVHNVLPHEPMPFARGLARLVLGRADLLVCHAKSIAEEARALGIRTPVQVTPLAPILAVNTITLPERPPVRLLCLGTVRRYKGVDLAIAAAALLKQGGHDVELTVAGEIWEPDCLPSEDELSRLGVPIRLEARYLTDEEMAQLLESHHVLVAPYRSATQSGVVSMALAAGRPAVVTRVGGLAEAVVEGVSGAVARPEDVEDLAAAIVRVMDSLDEYAAGAAASGVVWSDYADLLADVLDRSRR